MVLGRGIHDGYGVDLGIMRLRRVGVAGITKPHPAQLPVKWLAVMLFSIGISTICKSMIENQGMAGFLRPMVIRHVLNDSVYMRLL